MNYQKSIQELENNYWPDLDEYPTGLVERCHQYRKIKLKDLKINQMITLLIQDIGADFIMPMVLDRMEADILEEDDDYGSSFIQSIEFFKNTIFQRNPEYFQRLEAIIKENQAVLEAEMGYKVYERLLNRLEAKRPQNWKH